MALGYTFMHRHGSDDDLDLDFASYHPDPLVS